MRAVFVRRQWENAARSIMSFYFKPERPYDFQAGQYADITVPHANPDNRGLTRTMTFSSNPLDELVCITTRVTAEHLSTYKQALLALQPGDTISITDAMGDMVLPLDTTIPLVFVAGGVGIASYAGIINYLLTTHDIRQISLHYTVRATDDIAFQNLLDRYRASGHLIAALYTPIVNTPYAYPTELQPRRLTAAGIAVSLPLGAQVYLSGSMTMVEELRGELQSTFNLPQYRIAFDYFDGYTQT